VTLQILNLALTLIASDYVRTYTWDKKLENLIKDPLLIGGLGGKNEPTVVTPKTYKARFRLAMERYFGLVRINLHLREIFNGLSAGTGPMDEGTRCA